MLPQLLANGIIAGSIYALVAIGFAIIYRTVKFFHFAHGIVYTAGVYITYTLVVYLNLNFFLSFFLTLIFTALFGVFIDRIIYYLLRQQNASNLIFLLASFGIYIFFQSLIQLIYGAQILTLRTGPIKKGRQFLGAIITENQILILLVSIILILLLWLFIQKTKLGKAIRAVSDDYLAAKVVGINPERIIITSFAIGSALAGAAGVLISLETNIEPAMGFTAVLKGIIASIIGGIGSIPGALFGGFFIGIIENLGIWKISSSWKDTIVFFVLIVFLLLKPGGILGVKTEKEII